MAEDSGVKGPLDSSGETCTVEVAGADVTTLLSTELRFLSIFCGGLLWLL